MCFSLCYNISSLYMIVSFTNITQSSLMEIYLNKRTYVRDACNVKHNSEHFMYTFGRKVFTFECNIMLKEINLRTR